MAYPCQGRHHPEAGVLPLERSPLPANCAMELQAGCQRANATYQSVWSPESARITPAVWCEVLRLPVVGKPGGDPGLLEW